SEGWIEERHHFHYKPPPVPDVEGMFAIGAKEAWLERMEFLSLDLTWLLELQQFRFWSQIIYSVPTHEMIMSFLLDAPPYYTLDEFPQDEEIWNSFQKINHLVFLVINRLASPRESETEYISLDFYARMIYDNYVFTIPMFLDMCMCYGRENRAQIQKIISAIFRIQPKYKEDLKKSVPFISKVFRIVEHKFGGRKIPDGELVKITDRSNKRDEITLFELRDLILHVLDTAANLSIFLDIYTPACSMYHEQLLEIKIVHFYENTVPQIYRKLSVLADKEEMCHMYVDMKNKLDMMRVELLRVFRHCLTSCLNPIFEKVDTLTEAEAKRNVDDYVGVLTECLSEKVFIRDYHSIYPVDQDLDAMSQVCPEMDFMKCDFLLEAVLACFELPNNSERKLEKLMQRRSKKQEVQSTSSLMNGESSSRVAEAPKKRVTGVELESLITEVKDILPYLGDGFVEMCLEHFNFTSEAVINAVLEDTLPPNLQSIDQSLPRIPKEKEIEEAANCVQRLNVFDNDEFDIMTQDHVDTSRIHKGKRNSKHKNLNDLIDDKSHREEYREMYTKFGLVDTEGSMYDDEYDDTYDHLDVSVGDEGDIERRPFVIPRVLQTKEEGSTEDEDEEESMEPAKPPRDEFVQNPEEIRARAEQRRQQQAQSRGRGRRQGPPPKERDVVGRPKGQGQDKNVVSNRDYKNVHKATRGNHNRRFGAQKKRQQGMMPF
ncbi:hypothetical protein L9F63_014699, partial [Diploptera punctata]